MIELFFLSFQHGLATLYVSTAPESTLLTSANQQPEGTKKKPITLSTM
jgi:hypothetical protein